jgi:glycine betaine/choline ABC-type transport system substrate-binding protein
MMRRLMIVVLAIAWVAGCTDTASRRAVTPSREPGRPIVVASFDFTESRLVSEIYAQALDAAPGQNQDALAVLPETAARHGLSTVSDLRPVASTTVLGGPPECPTRDRCA